MRSSFGLFPLSPPIVNALIVETIMMYFDHYVKANLLRLMQVEPPSQIHKILNLSKQSTQNNFEAFLKKQYGEKNVEITVIYTILRRLIVGELTDTDFLMVTLKKIDPKITSNRYNDIVSTYISNYLKEYFNSQFNPPLNLLST